MDRLKRIGQEPLLHFLVIGAALFAAFSLASKRDRVPADAIVVSSGKIDHLAVLFSRTWQRPPTNDEMNGLVDDFVREEAAYREAKAIGLDLNDTVIRRRLRQKLEFVAEDLTSRAEPSDEDLAAYLESYGGDFRVPMRLTLRQVYLDADKGANALSDDALDLLTLLNGDPSIDATALGDPILLEHAYRDVSIVDVAALFGSVFATGIEALDVGVWHGPIESSYGLHLVRIDAREPGRSPQLAEVREQVRREWEFVRRERAIDEFYRALVDRYDVIIEWPEAEAAGPDS